MSRVRVRVLAVGIAAVVAVCTQGAALAAVGWTVQATPLPSGQTTGQLYDVSCATNNACMAVGFAGPNASSQLAESWNGSAWTALVPPDAGGVGSTLSGVSCVAPTTCEAVGINGAGVPYAAGWNGTSWTLQSMPLPSGQTTGYFLQVSCPGANACEAVGLNYSDSNQIEPLAERWNGTSWQVQSVPDLSGASYLALYDVSCVSKSRCVAVGNYRIDPGPDTPFAATWNGTAWSLQTMPTPANFQLADIQSVSCAAASACTAVGDWYDLSNVQHPLIERWDGTNWSLQAPVEIPSRGTVLGSVSCPTTDSCMAVGRGLVERWANDKWTAKTVPATPPSATFFALNGVSCTQPSLCTGVGTWTATDGHALVPLAERFAGSS